MPKKPEARTKRSAGATRGQLQPPPSLQVGALCWRRTAKGALRVLLITSRDTGRWVIPKGWPMRRRTEAEAAAREAWEEAGVRGEIALRPIGLYGYQKVLAKGRPAACVVRVYPLAAQGRRRDYPEAGQRRLKWFSPAKAARKVREPELARLIRNFDPVAAAAGGTPPSEAMDAAPAGAAFPDEAAEEAVAAPADEEAPSRQEAAAARRS
jgi:8-oxo-dGTP pyrophosphatase MutT (NUDIX family)